MLGNVILANAFSLSMIPIVEGDEAKLKVRRISIQEAKELLANVFTSAIGHQSTAKLLTQLLGVNVPVNRTEIKLERGQQLIVFQLLIRLQEGQVLSHEELEQLYQQGKVVFYVVQLSS